MMGVSLRVLRMKHMVRSVNFVCRLVSDGCEAGYTYCAIASLKILNRLHKSDDTSSSDASPGLTDIPATIRWLISRQIGYSLDEDSDDEEEELPQQDTRNALAGIHEDAPIPRLSTQDEEFIGFNGRCNKPVDTCYAFWVSASLNVTPLPFPFPLRPHPY
jgi:geranylgeranyl transferase type-1 subunit beta